MKKILAGLMVLSMLSVASVTYADRDVRHERQRARADHDNSPIVKLFFGFGGYPEYRGERHRPRYVEKTIYKERGSYGKRVVVKKKFYRRGHDRPYWKSVRYDKQRHNRHGWRDRGEWYNRYDWNDGHDRHDRFDRDERRGKHRR